MERETIIREIAKKHLSVETLNVQNSDSLDFHSTSVGAIHSALEAAYNAGRSSMALATDPQPPAEHSRVWTQLTVDDAREHLQGWIEDIEDPSQLAMLMIHVCGCSRAAVVNGTHIAAEMP